MIQLSYTTWDIIQAFPQEALVMCSLLVIMPLVTLEALSPGLIRWALLLVALACAGVSAYACPTELWLLTSAGFPAYAKLWVSLFYALVLFLGEGAGDKACNVSGFALIAVFLLVSSRD